MPYIPSSERNFLAEGNVPTTAGQVNYLASLLMNAYFESYDHLNDIASIVDDVIADLRNKGMIRHQETEFGKELEKICMTANVPLEDVRGAVRNAYMEFYFRKALPYEDKKIEENGPL